MEQTKLRLPDDQVAVSVAGAEYQRDKDGNISVAAAHVDYLRTWHGLLTPAEHRAREQAAEALAKAERDAKAAQERADREQRIAEAKALLEANGLAVTQAKK